MAWARFPAVQDFFSLIHSVRTNSGAPPDSYSVGTGGSFPGGKAAGREAYHLPPFSAEVKKGKAIRPLHGIVLNYLSTGTLTFLYNLRICLEWLRKTMKHFSQDSQCPDRDQDVCFRRMYYLLLQDRKVSYCSALNMEVACPSETSVTIYQTTRCSNLDRDVGYPD
jgi:hypothetical protein